MHYVTFRNVLPRNKVWIRLKPSPNSLHLSTFWIIRLFLMNEDHLRGGFSIDTLSSHQTLRLHLGSTKDHLTWIFLLFHGEKSSEIMWFKLKSLAQVLISWSERNYACKISVAGETSIEKLKHKVTVTCVSLVCFVSFQIIAYMNYIWNFEPWEWEPLWYMSKEWDRDKKWLQRVQ